MAAIDVLSSFLSGNGTSNDALKLAQLRDRQQGEYEDRLAGDLKAGDIPDATGTETLMKFLHGDEAGDPNVGTAQRQKVATDAAALHSADMYEDPRMTELRKQEAQSLQDTERAKASGTGLGTADAGVSANAEQLANEAHKRKMEELLGPAMIKASATAPKLQPRAADALRSIRELAPLIGQIEGTIKDPTDNSLGTSLTNRLGYGLYHMGIDPSKIPGLSDQDRQRMQLAGLIKVLGSSPYAASSRNFTFLKQAQEHLTDPAQTPMILANQLHELRSILPVFQNEILTNETHPDTPLNFNALSPNAGGNGASALFALPQGVTVKQVQ